MRTDKRVLLLKYRGKQEVQSFDWTVSMELIEFQTDRFSLKIFDLYMKAYRTYVTPILTSLCAENKCYKLNMN
jgi:hypothetical protein